MILRRKIPHPGAQLSFTDIDDTASKPSSPIKPTPTSPTSERYSAGVAAPRKLICNLKDTGCTNLPSNNFAINRAWLTTTLIAHDLLVCASG